MKNNGYSCLHAYTMQSYYGAFRRPRDNYNTPPHVRRIFSLQHIKYNTQLGVIRKLVVQDKP